MMTVLRDDRLQDRFSLEAFGDDDDILLPLAERAPHGALRLPDGRAMAWAEYGSARTPLRPGPRYRFVSVGTWLAAA